MLTALVARMEAEDAVIGEELTRVSDGSSAEFAIAGTISTESANKKVLCTCYGVAWIGGRDRSRQRSLVSRRNSCRRCCDRGIR
jgi:hypothetical protein